MRELTNIYFYVVAIIALIAVTGCSSSKKFAVDPIYDGVEKVKKTTSKNKKHNSKNTTVSWPSSKKLDVSSMALVTEAKKWIGTPYKYGGHSKSGTDCSGFMMEVYRSAVGVELPRTAKDQHKYAVKIDKSRLEVGDLVFFTTSRSNSIVSHVGMYVGDGKMIHASTSRGVMISGLDETYYAKNYYSSGRVAQFKVVTSEHEKDNGEGVTKTKSSRSAEGITKASEVAKAASKVAAKVKSGKVVATAADIIVEKAKSKPQKVLEVKLEDLDEILSQKIDSIYTSMFD